MTTFHIKRLNVTALKTIEADKVSTTGPYLIFTNAAGEHVYGIRHEHVVSWQIVEEAK